LSVVLTISNFFSKVDFEITIVKSFKGVTLAVGGDLETYWKSTAISGDRLTQLPPPRILRRPNRTGSVVSSPAYAPNRGGGQTLVISSLQGKYLFIVIQVTRDLHPVVYFDWLLPGTDFELGVADVTLAQFETLAEKLGRNEIVTGNSIDDWARSVSRLMISLDKLLKVDAPYIFHTSFRATYIFLCLRCFRLISTQLLI
jgi:CDK inhibitor PHO81